MMRALHFDERLTYRTDYPEPREEVGEALVRVLVAGICNTDLEISRGYMGFRGVIGHEFVGRVEKAADPALIGLRVVGEINASCGQCDVCRRGLERHCPHRTVLGILGRDGAFADYLRLPVRNLHPVPYEMSNERAVFAEPTAAAIEIIEQLSLQPGAPVAVLGDGKLGLLITLVLAAHELEVTLVGHHPDRMERVVGQVACFCCEDDRTDERFPVVVEATGNPQGFALAQQRVEPRGTIVLKSTTAKVPSVNLAQLVIDEVTVVGSRCGPFRPALRLLRENKVRPEAMIDARYALDAGLEAFALAMRPGTCKVLLEIEQQRRGLP